MFLTSSSSTLLTGLFLNPSLIFLIIVSRAGPDACGMAESIHESTVVIAITFNSPNHVPVSIPPCVYSPGELHDSSNPDLDEVLLESLAYDK